VPHLMLPTKTAYLGDVGYTVSKVPHLMLPTKTAYLGDVDFNSQTIRTTCYYPRLLEYVLELGSKIYDLRMRHYLISPC